MSDQHPENSWARKLRNAFFTGLIVLLPLAATTWILSLLYNIILGPISRPIKALLGTKVSPVLLNVIVLYFLFKLVIIVGLLTRSILGKSIIRYIERFFDQIPVFRNIYGTAKRVVEVLTDKNRPSFLRVVLVEYPAKGIQSLAFVTREDLEPIIKDMNGAAVAEGLLGIFIPTAPNPTSGYFAMVPKTSVIPLALSVEDALKLIISAGVLGPRS